MTFCNPSCLRIFELGGRSCKTLFSCSLFHNKNVNAENVEENKLYFLSKIDVSKIKSKAIYLFKMPTLTFIYLFPFEKK